jgi:signal transduction histidine kinase
VSAPGGLATRLAAAFVLVTVVAVGSVALLARRSGGEDFRAYVASQMGGRAMSGMGVGGPGSGGPGAGGAMRGPTAMVATAEEQFLRRLDQSLWTAAALAGGAALLVGIIAARQLTHPLRSLQGAAHRMGQGDLTARVSVTGGGELADVARTFNQMAASLEQQEAVRRSLVADVAHDLRTPVTVIQGTVDAILDGVYEPTAERLGSIREETERLAQLVRDLRDVSLAESGQLRLDRRPTDLIQLAQRSVRRLEPAAADHGIDLHVATESLPAVPAADADPDRIGQALDNLLTNALRHTPHGGEIAVRVAGMPASREHGPEITLTVADTGSGIAADDLPRVFDRFYRADPSRARDGRDESGSAGSGLGLAIVKAIAEAHGGRVWAESAPGRGSRFTLALPVA